MRRRRPSALRAAAGVALLVVAVALALLARGIDEAARAFDDTSAAWQRGAAPASAARPGALQALGERVLGIEARADLQRAHRDYLLGLADVIPGTTYPQTQARWNAIVAVERLRGSLDLASDRAVADVELGHLYAAGAVAAGPGNQRKTLRENAIGAFRRAVVTDPSNAEAKHALELLLAEASDAAARARGEGDRNAAQDKPTTTPRSETAGSGY